jgi:hypothetical protein
VLDVRACRVKRAELREDVMGFCEICKQPATMHVVDRENDSVTGKWYCDEHAQSLGLLSQGEMSASVQRVLHAFRRLIHFVKESNRWPTSEELRQLGAAGQLPVHSTPNELAVQLAYLELTAEFMEKNGRFPEEHELPPSPFVCG